MKRWSLIGLSLLCLVGVAAPPATAADDAPKTITVGEIKLHGLLPEMAASEGLFGNAVETLGTMTERLQKAADDKDLSAVILHIDNLEIGRGKLYELRRGIENIRKAGKPVYAYLESAGTPEYMLASACDRVVMPESGMVMLLGVRAEVWFYKDLFDKLEMNAEVVRIGEFKSAGEPYTRNDMSPEFRKEMDELLDDVYGQITGTIAKDRGLTVEQVKELIDEGPYNVPRAKEVKLVDEVGYEADVRTLIKKKFDDAKIKLTKNYGKKKVDADLSGLNGLITLMNALAGAPPSGRKSSNPKIGVLYGSGAIMTSAGTESLLLGEILESHTMIKAIRELRDDDTVKAVVIRIDSPGGSALASDLIWHELEELNKKKPLVASMSDVAGSGGYYIAMGADRIYAAPGTVTGSIGVVGGKVALEKTYEKLGIHVVTLERGKNSGLMSVTTPFTDSQREKTHRMMKEIYDQFTQKAADGRKMDVEKLEKLARGRIYSGERAKELGLVDEVGSLGDAIAKARELANLKEGDKVDRLELPKAVSPLEQLLGPVGSDARMARTIEAALNTAVPNWSVIARDLTAFRQLSHEPAITVMPFRINLH